MTVNLLDFDLAGLTRYFADELGEKPFRARQVMRWMHQRGAQDFAEMTDLAKSLREKLQQVAAIRPPRILSEHRSADGTVKWLIDTGTGNAVETVFIPEGDLEGRSRGPAERGSDSGEGCGAPDDVASIPFAARSPFGGPSDDAPGRYRGTLCISSQVGCALACTFCSTGRQGFNRNLSVSEIIGQLWLANKALGRDPNDERAAADDGDDSAVAEAARGVCSRAASTVSGRGTRSALQSRIITNVVMMGMGEPLTNFDNVVTALNIMLDDHAYGLSRRRVTVSTSGIVPAMDRLAERCPVALAVSLHAPNDALRDELVPINKKYPLSVLMAACQRYLESAPRDFITFEYVMLDGVNDTVAHARELVALSRDVPCKFNLIPFNPFPDSGYDRSRPDAIRRFREILVEAGHVVTTRKTRGDDIDAACGQLAGRVQDKTKRTQRILTGVSA